MKKHSHKILTLTTAFGFATLALHAANKFLAVSSQIPGLLNENHPRTYEWRMGNISYNKQGKGTPVLLVHDTLPGASRYEWKYVQKQLAEEHTVYSLDLLGCGQSDKPGITYTSYLFVQLIQDFVQNVIGEKCDIIASRFSSSYAIMAAFNNSEFIEKVILVNPNAPETSKKVPTYKERTLKDILEVPVFGTLIYHMIVSKESIREFLMDSLYHNPFSVTEEIVDTYYEAAHAGGCYAKNLYACCTAKYLNVNLDQAIPALSDRLYIISGEEESSARSTEAYLELNPSTETFTIFHTAKVPHLEIPEAFVDISREILAK